MRVLYLRKYIKNIGLILIILGHYYFCSYVLSEVHDMKNYTPKITINALEKEKVKENNNNLVTQVKKKNDEKLYQSATHTGCNGQ